MYVWQQICSALPASASAARHQRLPSAACSCAGFVAKWTSEGSVNGLFNIHLKVPFWYSRRFEARQESIVIEGVHLAPNAVMRLMARHPSVVPFLVYIRCCPCLLCTHHVHPALQRCLFESSAH